MAGISSSEFSLLVTIKSLVSTAPLARSLVDSCDTAKLFVSSAEDGPLSTFVVNEVCILSSGFEVGMSTAGISISTGDACRSSKSWLFVVSGL